jgi:hypothetical protein
MVTRSQQKSWETNKPGHCYIISDNGKWVFVVYDKFKNPYETPLASGKRDTVETAMAAARSAAAKYGVTIGTWSNLTSMI